MLISSQLLDIVLILEEMRVFTVSFGDVQS